MRKQVGDDFPIIVRLSGNEYVHGGRTEAETYELCTIFEELVLMVFIFLMALMLHLEIEQ